MSAVALLAIAFGAIALVGTALAAAHDLIAAAIDHSEAAPTDHTVSRAVAVRPLASGAAFPAPRATRPPGAVYVRVRRANDGAAPAARV